MLQTMTDPIFWLSVAIGIMALFKIIDIINSIRKTGFTDENEGADTSITGSSDRLQAINQALNVNWQSLITLAIIVLFAQSTRTIDNSIVNLIVIIAAITQVLSLVIAISNKVLYGNVFITRANLICAWLRELITWLAILFATTTILLGIFCGSNCG